MLWNKLNDNMIIEQLYDNIIYSNQIKYQMVLICINIFWYGKSHLILFTQKKEEKSPQQSKKHKIKTKIKRNCISTKYLNNDSV